MHNQVTWAGILFFNDTATTEIYTLSLHDALPISSEAPVYSVRDPDGVRQQVRWQELLTLAGRDIQGGNLDAAERKAREAQKLVPTTPDGLVLLAGIDERRGRSQQAGENFRKAAELAPQRGDVLNNYGAWLCQQGQAAESLI